MEEGSKGSWFAQSVMNPPEVKCNLMSPPCSPENSLSEHSEMDDSKCLDLSINKPQAWLIVHYEESNPGSEFEIVNLRQVVEDSWATLRKGEKVVVAYGNARVQGTVIAVSETEEPIRKNYDNITKEYLESRNKNEHRVKIKQEVIKVMDRYVQTEPLKGGKTSPDFRELKRKYEETKKDLARIKRRLKDIKNGVLSIMSAIDDDEDEEVIPNGKSSPRPILTATRYNRQFREKIIDDSDEENEADTVSLGPGKTKISLSSYELVKWDSYTTATRNLLKLLFHRDVLATHSLTGKPSPAFGDKKAKKQLDPVIVADIVYCVSKKCKVSESLVRSVITTKCADENKMLKRSVKKKKDAENQSP